MGVLEGNHSYVGFRPWRNRISYQRLRQKAGLQLTGRPDMDCTIVLGDVYMNIYVHAFTVSSFTF